MYFGLNRIGLTQRKALYNKHNYNYQKKFGNFMR